MDSSSQATILVVEDSPTSRLLLVTVLGYAGYRVIEAVDGAEAFDLARAQRPDLVISDILMPTMDGIEFANLLHGDEAIAHIPVIFYTSTYRLNEAHVLAQSCGVSRVLSKPSEPQVILNEVAIALGRESTVLPQTAKTTLLGLLGDKLPAYLHELVELQQRLHQALNEGLELIGENGPLRNVSDRLIDSYGTVQALSLQMAALLELGLVLSTERDLQQLLRLFCRAAQGIMNAKYAVVGVKQNDGQPLHFVSCGMTDTEVNNVLSALDPQAGIFGEVLADGKARRVSNIKGNQTVLGLPASHPPVQTFLVVPVISRTGTHGWLYFANKIGANKFGEDDEQFAMTLSAQLAPAYENLILYEEVQQHAGQLEIEFTERKRAEQALRESEERYRQLWETTTDAVILLGTDNLIQYANPAVQDIFGYAPNELVGQNLAIIQPEKLRAGHRHGLKRYLKTNVKTLNWRGTEALALHRDGHEFPVEIAFSHMVIGGKQLFAAFIRDVTERKRTAEGLRESESRFRQLAENVHEVFFLLDAGYTQILYVSPGYEEIWGRSCETLYADPRSWMEAIHPADLEVMHKGNVERDEGGWSEFDFECRIVRPDSSVRWVHARGFPVLNEAGETFRIAGFAEDITGLKEQQQKIARLNRIYMVLSGINSAIVRIRERSELFREACQIAVNYGGFSLAWVGTVDPVTLEGEVAVWCGGAAGYAEKIRLSALADNPDSKRPACVALRERRPVICNDIGTQLMPVSLRRELLAHGHQSTAAFPLVVENRAVGVLTLYAGEAGFFDEVELKLLEELAGDLSFGLQFIEKEEKLSYLAYYDVLTGLPNTTLFQDRLEQLLHASGREQDVVAVIMVDLENFSQLNEVLGRHAGDALLQQVAARMQAVLRDPYTLARVSGNTFAVAVGDLHEDADTAIVIEQRIFECLKLPFMLDQQEVRISARAGLALYPEDGDDAETLFKYAEIALKKAKAANERYLFFAAQMNAAIAIRVTMENDLRAALEKKQFVVYYQPRTDLHSGRIVGAEALIRWLHPQHGLVSPLQFIPLAEETGLIVPIGAWVIDTVCGQQSAWLAQRVEAVPVAVNLSAVQFRKGGVLETIADALELHRLAPQYVEFELTESVVMRDPEEAAYSLQKLKNLGVKLSLDDFGTGYSSLAYLKRFPFDFVKIDRAFVTDIITSQADAALANAIIAMAHGLDMQVIAEGVEMEDQLKYLRKQGCDEMQGYYFSPPVSEAAFAAMLREGKLLALLK